MIFERNILCEIKLDIETIGVLGNGYVRCIEGWVYGSYVPFPTSLVLSIKTAYKGTGHRSNVNMQNCLRHSPGLVNLFYSYQEINIIASTFGYFINCIVSSVDNDVQ